MSITPSIQYKTTLQASGQLGMFFGSNDELESFINKHNAKSANNIITPAANLLVDRALPHAATMLQRYKVNLTALRVLSELRNRNTIASNLEQQRMSRYVGWGSLSEIFDEGNTKSEKRRHEIKTMLTTEQYESARASTISAFYTPFALTAEIYKMLERAGFTGGRILDPAAGVGGLISPKRHQKQQHEYENSKSHYAKAIVQSQKAIASIKADIEGYKKDCLPQGEFRAIAGGYDVDKFGVAADLLQKEFMSFTEKDVRNIKNISKSCAMNYCGFDVYFSRNWGDYYINIEGYHSYDRYLKEGTRTSAQSLLLRVTSLPNNLNKILAMETSRLAEREANLATATNEVGKPFKEFDQLISAQQRFTEVKALLLDSQDETLQQAA